MVRQRILTPGILRAFGVAAAAYTLIALLPQSANAVSTTFTIANNTFPSTTVGQHTTQTVTLTVNVAVPITSIAIRSGFTEYTLGSITGCTIDPTGNTIVPATTVCDISVTYSPKEPGSAVSPTLARNAPLLVSDIESANPVTYAFGLTGSATAAVDQLTPAALSLYAGAPLAGLPAQAAGLGQTTAGYGGNNGPADAAVFSFSTYTAPTGCTAYTVTQPMAFDSAGNLYVIDPGNLVIRKIDNTAQHNVTIVAGVQGKGSSTTTFTNAYLNNPKGIVVDAAGNIYFLDTSYCLGGFGLVRRVDAVTGAITSVAGQNFTGVYNSAGGGTCTGSTGSPGYSWECGDGGQASYANLTQYAAQLAMDAAGNLYVWETGGGGYIRKINLSTGIITTIASAAQLGENTPAGGMTLAADGNFYVSVDTGTNDYIEQFNPNTQAVTQIAGGGSLVGNYCTVTVAQAGYPASHLFLDGTLSASGDLSSDGSGNIYLDEGLCEGNGDILNDSAAVWRINLTTDYAFVETKSESGGGATVGYSSFYGYETDPQNAIPDSLGDLYFFTYNQIGLLSGISGVLNYTEELDYTTSPQTLTATYMNVGNAAEANPSSSFAVGTNFVLNSTGDTAACSALAELAIGATCNLDVKFAPVQAGNLTDTLNLTEDGGGTVGLIDNNQTVTLNGTAVAEPLIAFAPPSINFGVQLVNTVSGDQEVTISNPGTGPLSISNDFTSDGSFTGFQVDSSNPGTCKSGTPVAAGGSCFINVQFAPTTLGALTENLIVNSNASNTNVNLTATDLMGTSVSTITAAATPVISPAGGTYNAPVAVQITDASTSPTIYYTTNGTAPVVGTSPTYSGVFTVAQSGTQVQAIATATGDVASGTATATYTVNPVIVFNPAMIGISAGSAQQLTATFSLAGTTAPTASLHYGHDYSLGAFSCTPNGNIETCSVPISFIPTWPGTRKDALFLTSGGIRVATVLLDGLGQAPLALIQPGVITNPYTSTTVAPYALAVDDNSTLYVTSSSENSAFYVPKGGSITPLNITGLNSNRSISVNGAGVLYLHGDTQDSSVTTYDTVQSAQGSLTMPGSHFWIATSVGNAGNFYSVAADTGFFYTIKPDGTNSSFALNPGVPGPTALAVDSSEDVFVGGSSSDEIMGAATASPTQIGFSGIYGQNALSLDAAGTLYTAPYKSSGYEGLAEIPASNYNGAPIADFDSTDTIATAGALGPDGAIYIGHGNNVDKIDRSQGAISFGAQTAGTASTVQTVSLYNGGNASLTLSSFALTAGAASGFALQTAASNPCSNGMTIPPGALCNVAVTLTAPGAGSFSGSIAFTTNTLNTSSTNQTVALSGFVNGINVTASPNPLSFTNQNEGTSSTAQSVTLTNNGLSATATISTPLPTESGYTLGIGTCNTPIAANGGTCQLSVTFSPTLAQPYDDTVNLSAVSNGGGPSPQTVSFNINGLGIATAPAASLSPNPLAFGGQVYETTSPAQAVVLSNTGGSALTGIVPTLTGTNPGDFAITSGTNACGSSLAAGSSCNIWITFTPINAGNLQATLSVADNATPSPQTAALTGTYDYFYSNVGTALAAQPVSVYIAAAGTLNSIQVLTEGAANLDFTYAPGGGCSTDNAYSVGQSCTVNVIFKPQAPGARLGAVLLTDAGGNVLGTTYLPGTGAAPEIVFPPAAPVALTGKVAGLLSVAIDSGENVYYADGNGNVIQLPWNGTSYGAAVTVVNISTLIGGQDPDTMAIDGAGNLYVGALSNYLVKIPSKGSGIWGTPVALNASGVGNLEQVAVDNQGNLYLVDIVHSRIVEMSWNGSTYSAPTTLPFPGGLAFIPGGVAVDGSGNVYSFGENGTTGAEEVLELPRSGSGYGTLVTIPVSKFAGPEGFAVDGNGDLYLSGLVTSTSASIAWIPWTGSSYGTQVTLAPISYGYFQLAVDGAGNVFSANQPAFSGGNEVVEFNVTAPPSLTFASTSVGSTSSDSPKTVPIWNIGNGDLGIQGASYPTDFPENTSDTNLCKSDNAVLEGASCDVSVNFTPTTTGLLSEDVQLIDNNLNVNRATQSIAVSGTAAGLPAPTINWTPATPITYGTALGAGDFAATASSGDANVSADGTFAYTISTVGGTAATATTVLPGGSDTLCVQWTPSSSFTSQYSSASLCVPIQVNPASTTISWTPVSPISLGASLGSGQLNATASSGSTPVSADGTFTYYLNVVGGTVANSSTVLPAGANTVCVQWTPSSSYTADYNSSQTCASITVNAPTATLTPNPVAFGNQAVGTTSAAQVATLQNTGNATLVISGITIGGTNTSGFAIGTGPNACGSTLAAGASCPVYVTFSPTSAITYSATLSVADNAIAAGGTSGNTSQLNITYFTIAESDKDGGVLCCGVSTNYVISSLGPDGLPVYNPSATATSGSIFAPHDLLANNEITWWSPTLNNGGAGGVSDVVETGTAVVSLPFANNSFFAPNGTGTNDSSAFQAAILSGSLNAPSSEQISFSIASDDMAFLYLDGVNVCDDGGVHGATAVPCTTATISAGNHSLELFYVDLDPTQAALNFSITSSGVTTIPGSGSPQTVALTGTGIAGTVINWTPSTPITYPATLGNSQFNATAFSGATNIGADGTFTYYVSTVGGTVATTSTVLPGGSNTLCVQWVPSSSFTSQYSSASQCSPITVNAGSTSISWSPSSATIIASSGPTAGQLDAAATNSGESNVTADGAVAYHLGTAGGTVITTGTALTPGPVTICAVWTPSSGFAADYTGNSSCQNFTVINTQPTTTTVVTNASPVFLTTSVTFTATVTPTSGTIVPTGTVTFLDGTTVIGTGTLSASGTGASAIAKLTTSSLAIGSQPITASYPGDTNNQASTTATLTEVVEDFSIVATGSTSSTIEPGTSTTFTFTVSPVAPATTFPAAIALTASGLPTGATYSFSPASIASGAGSTSVTLTVTTPITTLVRNQPPRSPAQNARWPVMALALLLLPLAGKFRRAGRGFSRMLSLVLLFAAGIVAAAALNGCGGIASGYFGQAPATSTITVTGTSGSLTHSASVSLTVE